MGIVRKHVSANLARSYSISLSPGLSDGAIVDLADAIGRRKALLVTTPSVAALYGGKLTRCLFNSGVDVSIVVLECSEQTKNMAAVEELCKECFRVGLDRTSLLIGCGGGVCTDLVTMASALTRRGLSYMRIPTTLVGLIDAGIGIKGAVNLPTKKSAIGCFYPPEQVFLDPRFIKTLPRELISDGLAEAIKLAVAVDAELFQLIECGSRELLDDSKVTDIDRMADFIWRSSVGLIDQLEPNLYEDQTYQRLLDFGHTFSPMIESESGFRVRHGTAVAIDIALSTAIATELNLLGLLDRKRILCLLRGAGLPIFSSLLTAERCLKSMAETEAHRGGHLNLVVPNGIGSATFITNRETVSRTVLLRALNMLRQDDEEQPRAHPRWSNSTRAPLKAS